MALRISAPLCNRSTGGAAATAADGAAATASNGAAAPMLAPGERPPRLSAGAVRVREYERGSARDRAAFAAINSAWIREFFKMEEHDVELLDDPEHHILDAGGVILLAEGAAEAGAADEVLGAVSLIPLTASPTSSDASIVSPDRQGYELAKMGTLPNLRSRGVGRVLGEAIMRRAALLSAPKLHIWSNRRLGPALALYRSLGFEEVPMGAGVVFERADIRLECAGERLAKWRACG